MFLGVGKIREGKVEKKEKKKRKFGKKAIVLSFTARKCVFQTAKDK